MAKARVHPHLECLVLCDDVRHSGNTEGIPDGVFDLIHVRTTLQVPRDRSFPYCHPLLYLFLRLSGPAGVASGILTIELDGDPSLVVAGEIEGPIELWGFGSSAHHVAELVDLEFPRAGIYSFRVRLNRRPASGEVRLLVE